VHDAYKAEQSSRLTVLLNRIAHGDRAAADRAFAQLSKELHDIASGRMRKERRDHTLQATALINEAYLKMFGHGAVEFEDRQHFLKTASEQMRHVLVDHARAHRRDKRGGGQENLNIDDVQVAAAGRVDDALAQSEALQELDRIHPKEAQVFKLRFLEGYTDDEVAAKLGVSSATVRRHGRFARIWLMDRMKSLPKAK
jgi:RNA polymerase sigma factor (TIGR02999 family)